MTGAKKTAPSKAEPQIDADALVPEAPARPESKVEAGLKAADKPAETPAPADDADAIRELAKEQALDILVKLGVPEEAAKAAVAGDMDRAHALIAEGGAAPAAPQGEICGECFTEGWDTEHIRGFDSVGCVHGSWKR